MRPDSDREDPGHSQPGTWGAWLLVLLVFGSLAMVIGACIVYMLAYPPYWTERLPVLNATGQPIVITDYRHASNVSYGELYAFLVNDTAEEADYKYPNYTCGDFARRLHDDAEAHGICSGIVAVTLNTKGYGGLNASDGAYEIPGVANGTDAGHAFNVFNTTDRGLVYIDATGITGAEKKTGRQPAKMVAYFSEGMPLGEIALNQSERFDYAYYQQREGRYELFVQNASRFYDDAESLRNDEAAFNDTLNGYYRDLYDFKNQYHSFTLELNSTNSSNVSGNVTPYALELWREVLADRLSMLDTRLDAIQKENATLEERRQMLNAKREEIGHSDEAKWIMTGPIGVVDRENIYW